MPNIQKTENLTVSTIRFLILHLGALCVFFVPFHWSVFYLFLILFALRMFAMEAGYHRYFSHRSFKTSRVFQFILALLAVSTGQRGILWWASWHRIHHKYADTPQDPHTPKKSFYAAHIGWYMDKQYLDTNLDVVKDLAKYPELVVLNKYHSMVPILLAVVTYLLGEYSSLFGAGVNGWHTLVWGFFLSTVFVLHITSHNNSLGHTKNFGVRRYVINDDATNNYWIMLPSMGASLHNNHHHYPSAARAGFEWWEIDLSYYIIKLLQLLRIVWDVKEIPPEVRLSNLKSSTRTGAGA